MNEEEFSTVHHELSSCGAVIAQIAFLDSSHFAKPVKITYLQKQYQQSLQNQNWALLLEPMAEDGEWKGIGVARIADDFKDGWETQEFRIV